MDINFHKHDKILFDVDEFSKSLNLHKKFVTDNSIQKTYYCLTWYFKSENIEEYFNVFINEILNICDKSTIQEMTATLEKSKDHHIHLAIMFKRTYAIYSKLNRKFPNINIEVVNKLDFDNIKTYCSKEFSRIKTISPIYWKLNILSNIISISKSNPKVLKVKENAILKTLNKNYTEKIENYKNILANKGIEYDENLIALDLEKINKGEDPEFMNIKANLKENEKEKVKVNEHINTHPYNFNYEFYKLKLENNMLKIKFKNYDPIVNNLQLENNMLKNKLKNYDPLVNNLKVCHITINKFKNVIIGEFVVCLIIIFIVDNYFIIKWNNEQ